MSEISVSLYKLQMNIGVGNGWTPFNKFGLFLNTIMPFEVKQKYF